MVENIGYYEQFINEIVKILNLTEEQEQHLREICQSYGVDWKLGE